MSRARADSRNERDRDDDPNKNFKVVVRVRPPLDRELAGHSHFQNTVLVESAQQMRVSESPSALEGGTGAEDIAASNFNTYTFTFDHVYGEESNQAVVYDSTARGSVMSTLQGYNATIIAYGQTGTGKTFTMEGEPTKEKRGIIPRATEEIFRHIENTASDRKKYLVRASYLQIYNEVISDLLKPERTNLSIREDKRKGVYVDGLSEWVVRSPREVYGLMQQGASTRATASTKMNQLSSRSHAVFIIILEQLEYAPEQDEQGKSSQIFKVGKLNLVDLAGSERVRLTGATGQRLEESKKINQSLSALGNVIAALTTQGRQHIPYRDSKLTRILEDSLGGNCKTTMMAMISPALEAFVESLSTLKFANRAKNIKNQARVNEDLDQKALLRKYEKEIKKLKSELDEKTRTVVDKRRLLQLQQQKEQAEKDKESAIQQLQRQSEEFMKAKEEKERLESQLLQFESQVIGKGVHETKEFQEEIEKVKRELQRDYDMRVAKLGSQGAGGGNRDILEEQRRILTQLTEQLRKRDEKISRMDEELQAYDRRQKMTEDELDLRNHLLIQVQYKLQTLSQANPELQDLVNEVTFEMQKTHTNGVDGSSDDAHRFLPQELLHTDSVRRSLRGDDGLQPGGSDMSLMLRGGGGEDMQMLQQQLEDVQAQKNELETIMRERLEKMVQAEVEDRMASMAADPQAVSVIQSLRMRIKDLEHGQQEMSRQEAIVSTLQQENARLQTEISRANAAAARASSSSNNDADTKEIMLLRQQLENEQRTRMEREMAVKKIFEEKVAVIVQRIAEGLSGHPVPVQAEQGLHKLQGLIKQTVRALE